MATQEGQVAEPWFIWLRCITGPPGEDRLMTGMPDTYFGPTSAALFFSEYPSWLDRLLRRTYEGTQRRLFKKIQRKIPFIRYLDAEIAQTERLYDCGEVRELYQLLTPIKNKYSCAPGTPFDLGPHIQCALFLHDELQNSDMDLYSYDGRSIFWTRRVYDFIHREPFENLPPYISDPTLGVFAQWRLKLGR